MYKHLLIPTDGSELSARAVEKGVELANSLGASVTFIYVQPEYPLPIGGIGAEGLLITHATREEFTKSAHLLAERILGEALETARKAGAQADSETSISDNPFQVIVKMAQDKGCDLIFMASHGRKGLAGILIGSETHKVVTHSTVPVLVYR